MAAVGAGDFWSAGLRLHLRESPESIRAMNEFC